MERTPENQFASGEISGRRDLLLTATITLSILALAHFFDAAEIWRNWAERHENWEIDEIPIALAISSFGIAWYAIRRWTDFSNQVSLTKQAYAELIAESNKRATTEAALERAKIRAEVLTEEAQRANRAKSVFLATMSHEIRTPMNGIVGLIDLLEQTEEDADKIQKIRTVRESSDALLSIIGGILDFSKIEAGELSIEQTDMSIPHAINGVVGTLTPLATSKNINLDVVVNPELPDRVKGDPVRIRQVLFNLIGNAIKFSVAEDGGPRDVVVRVGPCAERNEGKTAVRFTVADSGIGMSEEHIARLFTPFFQAQASTTRRFGGTGLGLSISKQLVDLMGGEIGVQSRVGEGSTFTVDLPFDIVSGAAASGDHAASATAQMETPLRTLLPRTVGRRSGRILLAEDNAINQLVIQQQLDHLGYDVTIASDGKQALQLLDQENFILLITDCHMPNMDGYELTQAIRKREQNTGKRLPIVAITATTVQGEAERCLAIGMDDYLTKPIVVGKLSEALEKWMGAVAAEETVHAAGSTANSPRHRDDDLIPHRNDGDAKPAAPDIPLDLAVLSQLLSTNDEVRLTKMLSIFRDTMASTLAELREFFSEGDAKSLSEAAHAAKGASATVGAIPVTSLLKKLELAAADADWTQMTAIMPEIDAAFSDLDHYIGSLKAA